MKNRISLSLNLWWAVSFLSLQYFLGRRKKNKVAQMRSLIAIFLGCFLGRRCVGGCGKTGRENGAMECSNIGARKGTYDAVKLEKGEKSRAVRSYADVTREDVQTPLGQHRLIIP